MRRYSFSANLLSKNEKKLLGTVFKTELAQEKGMDRFIVYSDGDLRHYIESRLVFGVLDGKCTDLKPQAEDKACLGIIKKMTYGSVTCREAREEEYN